MSVAVEAAIRGNGHSFTTAEPDGPHVRQLAIPFERSAVDEWSLPGSDGRRYGIQAYKNLGWVYAAVERIAKDIGGVPWVIRRGPKAEDPEAPEDNPLADLLTFPNLTTSSTDLFGGIARYLFTAGSAGLLLETLTADLAGTPRELWFLLPDRLDAKLSQRDVIESWRYQSGARMRTYPRDAVAFFRFFDPENPVAGGFSPQQAIATTLDMMWKAAKWNASYFKRGARPSAVAEIEQSLDEASYKRLQFEIKTALEAGVENAWRVFLFDGGIKLKEWEGKHSDMGFENLMRLAREEVLAANSTPPAVAGDFKNANYAQVEMQRKTYWESVQVPLGRLIEDVVNRSIAPRFGARSAGSRIPSLWFRFDFSKVAALQEDKNEKVDRDTKLVAYGLRTPNEILEEEGRDTYEGGDVHYISSALIPVGRPSADASPNTGDVPPPPPAEGKPDDGPAEPAADDVEPARGAPSSAAVRPMPEWRRQAGARGTGCRGVLDEEPQDPKERARFRRWRGFDRELRAAEREIGAYWEDKLAEIARYVVGRVRANPPQPIEEKHAHGVIGAPYRAASASRAQLPFPAFEYIPDVNDLVAEVTAEHGRIYQEILVNFGERAAKQAAEMIAADLVFDGGTPEILHMVERDAERIGRATANILDEVREELSAGINEGETIRDLTERIRGHMSLARAERIARTEAIAAANSGTNEGYRQGGIERAEWLSARDAFVRDSHARADGQVRSLDEPFDLVDEKGQKSQLMFPGDPAGPPGETVNCRCTLIPVVEEIAATEE